MDSTEQIKLQYKDTELIQAAVIEQITQLRAASVHPSNLAFYPRVRASRERSIALTKLEEAAMWLDQDIAQLRCDYPSLFTS